MLETLRSRLGGRHLKGRQEKNKTRTLENGQGCGTQNRSPHNRVGHPPKDVSHQRLAIRRKLETSRLSPGFPRGFPGFPPGFPGFPMWRK